MLRLIVSLLLCVHIEIDSQISFDCRIVLLLMCTFYVCLLCVFVCMGCVIS